ncbi:MAG: FAD-dependent oxidoreductase [Verrucomicrobiaceae bacterium]|nr:MAG: FAD-dependent oxidoreductase [Verrucomicrobiaceae bacterium]
MRLFLPLFLSLLAVCAHAQQYDVLVYGGTPAGIAAAMAAAEDGEKVLLVEPTSRIGGMVTNGLSHADFRTFAGLTGAYLNFTRRVEDHYREEVGDQAAMVSFRGTHAEPRVNLSVFERMLAGQSRITVQRGWALEGVKCSSDGGEGENVVRTRTAEIALFADAEGHKHPVPAHIFIDASYEGDLMAATGVAYRVGREGRKEFGESLAPEESDTQLQGYNFRLTLTCEPSNRLPVPAPEGYDRELFLDVLPLLDRGKVTGIFGMAPTQIYKTHFPPLLNGKYDINDMSQGLVRLSLPGLNDAWPDGRGGVAIRSGLTDAISAPPFSRTALAMARTRVFDIHLRWNVGLLYFLQNDEEVPEKFREEARQWGLCKDEFTENGGLPLQLYVREARRMIGEYLFSEQDTDFAPGDARAVLRRDSIAMGDYGPNCHGTAHEGELAGGRHTGEFYKPVSPYQIPYGVLLSRDVDNLLAPGTPSSTHVGFCALRLEPIWMSLGEAAGHAAHLARVGRCSVQRVPVAKLQARLHERGAATIYMSDVLPGHPDFPAVQWWATAGGFHGLASTPAQAALRGKQIQGQYFEAFPNHDADLDKPLDPALAARWQKLAGELGFKPADLPATGTARTRGGWIRAVWKMKLP